MVEELISAVGVRLRSGVVNGYSGEISQNGGGYPPFIFRSGLL